MMRTTEAIGQPQRASALRDMPLVCERQSIAPSNGDYVLLPAGHYAHVGLIMLLDRRAPRHRATMSVSVPPRSIQNSQRPSTGLLPSVHVMTAALRSRI